MRTFLYLLLSVFLVSCSKIEPNGAVKKEVVPLLHFNKVNLRGNYHAFYVRSTKDEVHIETNENIIKNLNIDVRNSTLYISENRPTKDVSVYNLVIYSSKDISHLKLKNNVVFTASSQIVSDDFTLKLKENSTFKGHILANKAKLKLIDNSKIELAGKTIDAEVIAAHLAQLDAPYWYVSNLDVNTEDNSVSKISVNDQLTGTVSGTSQLIYTGNPSKKITQKDQSIIKQEK